MRERDAPDIVILSNLAGTRTDSEIRDLLALHLV